MTGELRGYVLVLEFTPEYFMDNNITQCLFNYLKIVKREKKLNNFLYEN